MTREDRSQKQLPQDDFPKGSVAELNRQLFLDQREAWVAARDQNFMAQDQAVLTLSTAALGLSIGFLREVPGTAELQVPWLLVASWSLFGVAIVATVMSFITSRKAIDARIDELEDIVLRDTEPDEQSATVWVKTTTALNSISATSFVAAIISTIIFVSLNLP